jgi:hypothetical protein
VKISGVTPGYFPSLQAAYDAAVDGDTIQAHFVMFNEDLTADMSKSVTLDGGYDCSYADTNGTTTVSGNITMTDGVLTVENVSLE